VNWSRYQLGIYRHVSEGEGHAIVVAGAGAADYDRLPPAFSHGFKFRRGHGNPLNERLVVIDEASMVDINLMADLLSALRPEARLILVGDSSQLPSVGPGAILRDLLRSGVVPNFELTVLKRQDPNLLIARNGHAIRYQRRVTVDNRAASDFFFIPADEPEEIARICVDLVCERLPRTYDIDPMRDIVTLTARVKQGATSAESLNERLRRCLNPGAIDYFAPGDRVIQCHNDYERDVLNGELRLVQTLNDDGDMTIEFEIPPRLVEIPRQEQDLMHAWALTTHKFQGSEAPWVVVPVHEEQGSFVVSAQHFYTAISRARSGCVVVGQRAWMDRIAANHREDKRSTRLAALLL